VLAKSRGGTPNRFRAYPNGDALPASGGLTHQSFRAYASVLALLFCASPGNNSSRAPRSSLYAFSSAAAGRHVLGPCFCFSYQKACLSCPYLCQGMSCTYITSLSVAAPPSSRRARPSGGRPRSAWGWPPQSPQVRFCACRARVWQPLQFAWHLSRVHSMP
jgi:hypothetical protein